MKELVETKNIAVFGGGRWSKVLLEVLLKNTGSDFQFTVHSKHLSNEICNWSNNNNYANRINVYSNDPDLQNNKYIAFVVVNSAKDHKEKAMLGIKSSIPVLVEKPMTPSFNETKELIDLAKNFDVQLFSSWVFKYTSYIDNFIKHLNKYKPIKEINILWSDHIKEKRYGEAKTFDIATTLFEDVLPHVISILSKILDSEDFKYQGCSISRGGATIEINILSGEVKCLLAIERNASERVRKILVNSSNDISLDFSNEPGIIRTEDKEYSGDLEWKNSTKPLSRMIIEFIDAIKTKNNYKNLGCDLALVVSKLSDEIKPEYFLKAYRWFIDNISNIESPIEEDHLVYFISEVIYRNSTLTYKNKDKMISNIMNLYYSNSLQDKFTNLNSNNLIKDVNEKIFAIGSLENKI